MTFVDTSRCILTSERETRSWNRRHRELQDSRTIERGPKSFVTSERSRVSHQSLCHCHRCEVTAVKRSYDTSLRPSSILRGIVRQKDRASRITVHIRAPRRFKSTLGPWFLFTGKFEGLQCFLRRSCVRKSRIRFQRAE